MNEADRTASHHVRETFVALLIIVACLAFTVATPAVWAKRNLLDTQRFVSRAAPLAKNPDVQNALADRITTDLMQVVDPSALFAAALPERGQILAQPLSVAVQSFVHDTVVRFMGTDAFQRLWNNSLERAHRTAVRALNGDRSLVVERNGVAQLDLVPIINSVLTDINQTAPEVLGRNVQLRQLPANADPTTEIRQLAAALGRDLPPDFGQLTVYDRDKLSAAQEAVHLLDRFAVPLAILAIVLGAIAILITGHRRRTVLYLAGGVLFGMVVIRRAVFALAEQVQTLPPTATSQKAIRAVLDVYLDPLTTYAAWVIGAAILVFIAGAITSNMPWAVALRRHTGAVAESIAGRMAARDTPAARWARTHAGLLRFAVPVLAALLLWLVDLSWVWALVVVLLVIVYEIAVALATRPPRGGDHRAMPAASAT